MWLPFDRLVVGVQIGATEAITVLQEAWGGCTWWVPGWSLGSGNAEGQGASAIKLKSSSVIGLTFLSLLVELELDVICTFPKGPDLLTGSSGADSSVDPMGEDASRCGYQGSSWPTSSASCVLQNSHCMQ